MANGDTATLIYPYSREVAIESRHLTGSAPGRSKNSQTGEGQVRQQPPLEEDKGQRSSRSPTANSADLLKCQRSPSCATFSSWFTPVASARQRHDSVALEFVAHAQWGAEALQLGGRWGAQVALQHDDLVNNSAEVDIQIHRFSFRYRRDI